MKTKPRVRIRFRPGQVVFNASADGDGYSAAPVAVYTRGEFRYNEYLLKSYGLTKKMDHDEFENY
jgi:hypothetical protein